MVRNGLLKACIDDVLTVCNGDHLLNIERLFPAEKSRDVGRPMVEREEIERPRISSDNEHFSFRTCMNSILSATRLKAPIIPFIPLPAHPVPNLLPLSAGCCYTK